MTTPLRVFSARTQARPPAADPGEPLADAVDLLCTRVIEATDGTGDDTAVRADLRPVVDREVRFVAPLADQAAQRRLANAAHARLTGIGELDPWVRDPDVDEVLVNANSEIWVDRGGALVRVGELRSQPLGHIIERILAPIGRRLDSTSPIVDARLADGSRVCAVSAPVSVDGTCLSIRRFAAAPRPLQSFTDVAGAELIAEVIEARCNLVVTGATSSGKTSLLASIIASLDSSERIVVIEDTAELPLGTHHVVRLEARPTSPDGPPPITLPELVRTALRLRPDRLIVGEIRGDEVLGMVQAMNTGHDGSFSTVHANGPLDAMYRLESLVLRAAPTWPMPAIREQLARSIDVVVHVGRGPDGIRRVQSVSEVDAALSVDGTPHTRPVAEFDGDSLVRCAPLTRRR
jgi:pilus assembly protein CpaF